MSNKKSYRTNAQKNDGKKPRKVSDRELRVYNIRDKSLDLIWRVFLESHWSVFYPDKYSNPETGSDDTLYMRIIKVCDMYPSRIALEYGNGKMTYAALREKIDEAALAWQRLGVKRGDVVMLAMGNNPINVISIYSLDKIGASAALTVPNQATEYFEAYANIVNAKFCVMSCNQYLNYSSVLKNTKIKTIVIGKYIDFIATGDKFAFHFYPLTGYDRPKPKSVPEGIRLIYWKDLADLPEVPGEEIDIDEDKGFDRDNKRIVLYLPPSVPTANCKATELSARSINIAANLAEMVIKTNEDLTGNPVRTMSCNECCFAFGFQVGIHDVLCCGQTVLLFTWFDSNLIFFSLKRYKPEVLIGYNSTIASINKADNMSTILKSVDRIIVGGGLLTSSQKANLFEIAKNSGRKLSVCSVTCCDELLTYAYGPSDLDSDRLLGFPLPGVLMRVADSNTGLDAPEGTEGEIAVCSPIATSAGLGDGKVSREKYRKLPDGRHWYFTGMIGKQDGNKMFYLVASKLRETRINGYPVYPERVDEAVQMTEGVVESCSVIIERDDGPVLVTAVVPQEEYFYDNSLMETLRDRIKSECEMTLHEAMRPSEIMFFVSLPRDSKGSIDYHAVSEKIELTNEEEPSNEAVPDTAADTVTSN